METESKMEDVTNTKEKIYDNMEMYIKSVYNVFLLINNKAEKQMDKRLKLIALTIFNYSRNTAKDFNIIIKDIEQTPSINLIPIFEYISFHNIELYDFKNINVEDVNVSKKEDLERFVLTHIYYITQCKI